VRLLIVECQFVTRVTTKLSFYFVP